MYAELGLSIPRFNLLWVLYRSEGKRLSIGGLADNMGISTPSVMTMVQALESEEWLVTAKGTADRRVTFAELSGHCEQRFAAILQAMLQRWDSLWSCLSDQEQESLMSLLAKLRSSLLQEYIGESGLAAFRATRNRRP
jgi:DNA-binding MarR family transcriptional regulator